MKIKKFNESNDNNNIEDVIRLIKLFNDNLVELFDEGYYYYFKFDSGDDSYTKRIVIDNEQKFTYKDIEFLSKNLERSHSMHDNEKKYTDIFRVNFYLVTNIQVIDILNGKERLFNKESIKLEEIKNKIEKLNSFYDEVYELNDEILYYMSRIPSNYKVNYVGFDNIYPPEGGIKSKVMVEIKIDLK